VLAVGTTQGAPIPRAGGGFVTDRSGNIAVPRLEASGLRKLAAAGGGRYAVLTTNDQDIETLLSQEMLPGGSSDGALATDQWQEEGPWLLLLLVPLAAFAFRRGLVLVLLVFLLPVAQPVYAFDWDDLWLNKDQQAERLLDEGSAIDAADLFDDPRWRAVANYRAGEYGGSAADFASQEDPRSLYNLGNALARLGEFESAIGAYEEVLEEDPDFADAQYNRDLLAEMLEQSQDSQDGEQENGSESGGGAEQSEGQGESDQSGEEGAAGDPGSEGEPGESSVRDEEAANQEDMEAIQAELERAAQEAKEQSGETQEQEGMTQAEAEAMRRAQEQQQAMEQWLRRIPDDPGGLLRRKFRYQYQRQGRDQDGNSLWPDDEVQPW